MAGVICCRIVLTALKPFKVALKRHVKGKIIMLVKRNAKIQPLKEAMLNDVEVLMDFLKEVERNSRKTFIEKSALNKKTR